MVDSGPPPPKNRHFLLKNGLKMPFLGRKQCYLGSGGQFNTPPPYFAGARPKHTCVAGLGSRKIGDSGHPPTRIAIFCRKMALKCHFWAENSSFWGRVVSLTPPHPISQVLDSKKHVFQG